MNIIKSILLEKKSAEKDLKNYNTKIDDEVNKRLRVIKEQIVNDFNEKKLKFKKDYEDKKQKIEQEHKETILKIKNTYNYKKEKLYNEKEKINIGEHKDFIKFYNYMKDSIGLSHNEVMECYEIINPKKAIIQHKKDRGENQ
jgi:uncharacterized protein YchJ